jgi:hypothetical protein
LTLRNWLMADGWMISEPFAVSQFGFGDVAKW